MFLTLLPYLTVAANLALVLGVLLSLSQRVRQIRTRTREQEKNTQTETARLSAEIAQLNNRVLELEQSAPGQNSLPAPAAAGPAEHSLNNTLRSKVLKMHRLGQPSERIAGSLRVARGEVDLLVKVHKIVMRPYEEVVLAPALTEQGKAEKVKSDGSNAR